MKGEKENAISPTCTTEFPQFGHPPNVDDPEGGAQNDPIHRLSQMARWPP
jgi:hypothetical protein